MSIWSLFSLHVTAEKKRIKNKEKLLTSFKKIKKINKKLLPIGRSRMTCESSSTKSKKPTRDLFYPSRSWIKSFRISHEHRLLVYIPYIPPHFPNHCRYRTVLHMYEYELVLWISAFTVNQVWLRSIPIQNQIWELSEFNNNLNFFLHVPPLWWSSI